MQFQPKNKSLDKDLRGRRNKMGESQITMYYKKRPYTVPTLSILRNDIEQNKKKAKRLPTQRLPSNHTQVLQFPLRPRPIDTKLPILPKLPPNPPSTQELNQTSYIPTDPLLRTLPLHQFLTHSPLAQPHTNARLMLPSRQLEALLTSLSRFTM